MAELETTSVDIMPVPPAGLVPTQQGDFGVYRLQISEYSASGAKQDFAVAIPQSGTWPDVMLRAALLKKTTFEQQPMPMIIHGVIYADRMGLDIMAGDVYLVSGRPAISNKAKIKMALATGNIEGIETEMRDTGEPFNQKCAVKNDLECTVTITVKGWKKPLVRKARLSRWFKGKNVNWVDNPEHMLELNTVAHACEYIAPGGTDASEAPPLSPVHSSEIEQAVSSVQYATAQAQWLQGQAGLGAGLVGSTVPKFPTGGGNE